MNDFKFKAPIRTAFYIRVSTEEQDEKYGKDLQRTAMVDLLKSKAKLTDSNTEGYLPPKPEHIYYDDISGTKNREERPAMAKMCDDIINCSDGTTPFDVVFIFKLDRLARKLTILLDIIDFFESHNIQIVSARENIDTTTPFGRAMLGILGVIAELEIETIKDRTHSGKLSAVRKGVLMQDKYGFNRREGQIPTINIEEAPIITRIFKSFVYERLTIYEIAKQLTEEKISNPSFSKHPERYDKRNPKNPPYYWASETIRGLLKDYIYIGDYYYGKTKNKKDTDKENWVQSTVKVPQIVDTLLFEKAQELLCLHNRNIPQDDRKTYLLRGLLKCDDCFDPDKDLTGRVAWHGVPDKLDNGNVSYSYKCRRRNTSRGGSKICRMIPLPAKDIENYVIGFIKKLLANPKVVFDYQNSLKSTKLEVEHLKGVRDSIIKSFNAKPAIRENLLEQHSIGAITTAELSIKLKEHEDSTQSLTKRLKEIERKIQSFDLEQGYIDALDTFAKRYQSNLDNLTRDSADIYTIIHMLVEEVVVYGRPRKETDKLSGQKKNDQMIPHKLHIKIRLPQQILEDIASARVQETGLKMLPLIKESEDKKSIW